MSRVFRGLGNLCPLFSLTGASRQAIGISPEDMFARPVRHSLLLYEQEVNVMFTFAYLNSR